MDQKERLDYLVEKFNKKIPKIYTIYPKKEEAQRCI